MTSTTPAPWDFSGPAGRSRQNACAAFIANTSPSGSPDHYEGNALLIETAPRLLDLALLVAAGNTEFETLEEIARTLCAKVLGA